MRSGTAWRARRATIRATWPAPLRRAGPAILAIALLAGGCTTDGGPGVSATGDVTGSVARTASSAAGATVAFESIDGPPIAVFQQLVQHLATEADARQVTVVSRESGPAFRIRGYLAAHVESGRTHIGWVWDVYDVTKRRALRIAGELPAGTGHDPWATANPELLRKIARDSMDRLIAFLANPPPPAPEPASSERAVADAAPASRPALALADGR